jgi:hypothetical protein
LLHFHGLGFASLSSLFGSQSPRGNEASCIEEPASDHSASSKARGFARQKNEYGLRDILGEMRVANLSQRGRVNQSGMPLNQLTKGALRPFRDIALNQFPVIHVL